MRAYLGGDSSAPTKACEDRSARNFMLCALPVADAEDVGDLVNRVLGSERGSDKFLLLELAESGFKEHFKVAKAAAEESLR